MHHTLCCPFTQFKKLPFFLCQRNEKLLLFVRHFSLDKTTFSNLISSTYSKITFICHFICRPLRVIIACRILAHGPNSYLNITRVWVRCIACCFRSIAKQVKEGEKAAQTKFPSPFYTENHSRFFAIVINAKQAFALALSVFFCYGLVIHPTFPAICALSAPNTFGIKLNGVDVTEFTFTYSRKYVPLSLLIHFFAM